MPAFFFIQIIFRHKASNFQLGFLKLKKNILQIEFQQNKCLLKSNKKCVWKVSFYLSFELFKLKFSSEKTEFVSFRIKKTFFALCYKVKMKTFHWYKKANTIRKQKVCQSENLELIFFLDLRMIESLVKFKGTRVQFHQRSTHSFCANSLAPVKNKPKT